MLGRHGPWLAVIMPSHGHQTYPLGSCLHLCSAAAATCHFLLVPRHQGTWPWSLVRREACPEPLPWGAGLTWVLGLHSPTLGAWQQQQQPGRVETGPEVFISHNKSLSSQGLAERVSTLMGCWTLGFIHSWCGLASSHLWRSSGWTEGPVLWVLKSRGPISLCYSGSLYIPPNPNAH